MVGGYTPHALPYAWGVGCVPWCREHGVGGRDDTHLTHRRDDEVDTHRVQGRDGRDDGTSRDDGRGTHHV